ncbi:MAG: hypothetical protein NWF02_05305 [Candidatus Bathyarchaeota archaeon]|nr:hypothetical protein [Candidatus Bathyarchaeum sp.]
MGLKIGMGTEGENTGLLVVGNQLVNNSIGLVFSLNMKYYTDDKFSMNTQLYKNSFINNHETINHELFFFPYLPGVANGYVNIWDNGSEGNYWSFYNGTDTNNDGIIDVPLELAEENIDNYPLLEQVEIQTIPEFSSLTVLSLIPLVSLVVLVFRRTYIKHQ